MSWNDFYRRRDVLEAVLRQARHNPAGSLPFAEVPGAEEAFGTRENLLLALHYKWTQLLSGHLRAGVAGPEDADGVPGGNDIDHVDAVSNAWRTAVRDNETLRAVLDAHADRLGPVREAEQRMLAVTAGLAEPHEPAAEATKVGAAFETLLRNGPAKPARRRNPVGHLLRLLAPSA
ncbi:hypothetical protein [Amycolatopsis nigrescens]|uniref:hypothetical protein n=1 Tax=Amycolatopsis nigrescens TaxID=381445 RepID=UPI0003626426|nr:hypothetical protein [Amycolatopsis nigrescens]